MTFDPAKTLADMLTEARQSGCGCSVCVELRSLWTNIGLDEIVRDSRGEVPRPGHVCSGCWASDGLEFVRRGGAALATLSTGTGRCAMCGFPVNP